MESDEGIWKFLSQLPNLINEYSTYSYVLLLLLALGGIIILSAHVNRKRRNQEGLSGPILVTGALLLFLSTGGMALKISSEISLKKQQEDRIKSFFDTYRVSDDEHWVLITDSINTREADGEQRRQNEETMNLVARAVREILLEDIPGKFEQPFVKRVPLEQSPWGSVDDQNFDDVIDRLNGDELMWGSPSANESNRVTAFMAISAKLGHAISRRAPLKDFDFEQDPRRGLQFNPEGYNRLLGMALETVQAAQNASGDARKAAYFKAVEQLTEMRRKVVNSRGDAILSRTIYSADIDKLIADCQEQAGLLP